MLGDRIIEEGGLDHAFHRITINHVKQTGGVVYSNLSMGRKLFTIMWAKRKGVDYWRLFSLGQSFPNHAGRKGGPCLYAVWLIFPQSCGANLMVLFIQFGPIFPQSCATSTDGLVLFCWAHFSTFFNLATFRMTFSRFRRFHVHYSMILWFLEIFQRICNEQSLVFSSCSCKKCVLKRKKEEREREFVLFSLLNKTIKWTFTLHVPTLLCPRVRLGTWYMR